MISTIVAILAGLILADSAMRSIPSVGGSLVRLENALAEFRVIIGVIILAVGLLNLLTILFGFHGWRRF
jgi:hypothetical protein